MHQEVLVSSQGSYVRYIVKISMLSAVAVILMLLEVPLPFIAPPFYQIDLSEVPVLIGGFALGPIAGAMIEIIKILLNLIINGTKTAGVGELANLLIGISFVFPAAMIYKYNKSKKMAILSLAVGGILMTVVACLLNAFVLLPIYGKLGIPVIKVIEMGSKINPAINSLFTFIMLAVMPFNLIKAIVVSLIVILLYKKLHLLLNNKIGR